MQSSCIHQHSRGTVHRIATNLFLEPDRPVSELLPYDMDDQTLFRGSVPQASDWLRSWSACRNASSFLKAEKHYETEDFKGANAVFVTRRSFLFAMATGFLSLLHITHP